MSGSTLLVINIIIALASLGVAGYAAWALWQLRALRNNFSIKNHPVNLEELISTIAVKIRNLERGQNAAEQAIAEIQHKLQFVFQHSAVVRYDSLSDQGGNLSFSAALLDASGNGLVITNIHGREQDRIYAKPLVEGASGWPLTSEEQDAIMHAQTPQNSSKTKQ